MVPMPLEFGVTVNGSASAPFPGKVVLVSVNSVFHPGGCETISAARPGSGMELRSGNGQYAGSLLTFMNMKLRSARHERETQQLEGILRAEIGHARMHRADFVQRPLRMRVA